MIIWRGWGVLAVLYAFAAMILFTGVGSQILPSEVLPFSAALGLAVAAIATWFTGIALNRSGPQGKVDLWIAERNYQLTELVETGQFSLGPGQPQPQSLEEAREMAATLFEYEKAELNKAAFNRHTLFWIPLQYISFGLAAIAVTILISSLF